MADVTTQVGGHTLALSNLDKVLFPAVGFTKAEVIEYYLRIAPVLLPHLAGRTVTRVRLPNGVGAQQFFEKNPPPGAPDWLATQPVQHDDLTRYVTVDEEADLVYLANLAALELHAPQWRVDDATLRDGVVVLDGSAPEPRATTLVVDLDPGAGVTMPTIAEAALILAAELAADGIIASPKTSGSKGIQLYAPIEPTPAESVVAYVRSVGQRAAEAYPDRFVLTQTRSLRDGVILVDYLQNKAARTTVAPYSLRARERATVSAPVTWDEVADASTGTPLSFTTTDVLARVAEQGDLFADVLSDAHRAPVPDAPR